jgi:hypothetical protein
MLHGRRRFRQPHNDGGRKIFTLGIEFDEEADTLSCYCLNDRCVAILWKQSKVHDHHCEA